MNRNELTALLEPTEKMETIIFTPSEAEHVGFDFKPFAGASEPQAVLHISKKEDSASEFLVTRDSFIKLGQKLKVPGSYTSKVPTELMIPHMNYWMAHTDGELTAFVGQNGIVQHFASGARHPISNLEIIDCVYSAISARMDADAVSFEHVHHDMYGTQINIKLPVEVDMGAGTSRPTDMVAGGLSLHTSFTMETPLDIGSYLTRLICTNGLVSTTNVFRLSRKFGGDPDEWLNDAIERALSGIEDEMEALRSSREVQIEGHVSDALRSIFEEFSVPNSIREMVNMRVIDMPASTLYDVVQVITDVASNDPDVRENAALQRRLMQVGSNVTRHREFCDNCHRIIA